MSTDMIAILILFGLFFILMAARIPIAFALIFASIVTTWYIGIPSTILFQKMINGLNSFTFLAVPFFIVGAQIMTAGGISDRLLKFSDMLIGRVRGGTAMVNILTSMFFGGISGSSVADVSSVGSFLIPFMRKQGYDKDYSVAVTVTSSVQGVIIPPSQNMIYFSLAAGGVSLGKLFVAGYIPGILLGGTLMLVAYVIAVKRKYLRNTKVDKSQKKDLYVIGTAISSEYVIMLPPGSMCPDSKDYGVFWVKNQFAQDTLGFDGACNSIVGIFTPNGKKNSRNTLDTFTKTLSQYGVFASTLLKDQNSNLALSSEMASIQSMSTMLPIIFLGVAALVLNVIMTRLAEQERTIIGTLKALGVRNRAIFSFYLKYSLFVGISGGILGCFLGHWIASQMTQMYQGFFTFPDLHNGTYLLTMLIGIFISILFSVLGTIRGVKLMLALNPAEAMHPPPPANGKAVFIERFKTLWSSLGFRSQMVVRGIFRNKVRTLIGILASAFGSGLVLMSLGMLNSMDYMMDFQFKNVIHCNYQLHFKTPLSYDALYEAQNLPGITHAEPQLELIADFTNGRYSKKCVITGLLPESKLITPCARSKERIRIPETGVLITKRLAEHLHVKPGDYITFTTIRGIRTPHSVKVVNTVESTIGIHIYTSYNYLNNLLGEDHIVTNVLLKAQQTPEQKTKFLEELKKIPTLTSYNDTKIAEQQFNDEMRGSFSSMIFSMIFFAAIIFFGSILNSALISISERKREIATFRVLGYRPSEIGSLFLRETLLINMTGAVVGLPLGYLLLYGTCYSFSNDMYSMPCIINISSYAWTLILSFFFIMGSFYIIQRTINKLDWPEALKAKE